MQFKKINRLVCGGLVTSFLFMGVSSVKAQTGNQSDVTNVIPGTNQSDVTNVFPDNNQSDVTNVFPDTNQSDVTNPFAGDSSGSGVPQETPAEGSNTLNAGETNALTASNASNVSIQIVQQILGASTGAVTTTQAQNGVQQQINALLSQNGATDPTLSTGVTVSTTQFSAAMGNLMISISPGDVKELLFAASSDSNGVLVASSRSVPLLAQRSDNDVTLLYNTFQESFLRAGLERDEAQEHAQNLVVSLASIKTWFKSNGGLNYRKINASTRSMGPILETLPSMSNVVKSNSSLENYSLVLMTLTGIETVTYPLQAINDAV